jgi:hypothetical protein
MGPGNKCDGCGDASAKNVGDEYHQSTRHYYINYQVKEENGVKYWDIVESSLNTSSLEGLSEQEQQKITSEYSEKTNFVKIQDAYENTAMNRAKVLFGTDRSMTYTIDADQPTVSGFLLELVDPMPSSATITWNIDHEGFINVNEGEVLVRAGIGSGLKALQKAKPIWKFLREGEMFKEGTDLQKMLANYWKKGASVGNGGTADMVLHEFQTGSELGHLQKLTNYRKAFMRALRGEYGALNSFQKEFLIRELHNMQRVFNTITKP